MLFSELSNRGKLNTKVEPTPSSLLYAHICPPILNNLLDYIAPTINPDTSEPEILQQKDTEKENNSEVLCQNCTNVVKKLIRFSDAACQTDSPVAGINMKHSG